VEVHHDEGVANRIDPESCAAAREGNSEALTGERAGQPLSREGQALVSDEHVRCGSVFVVKAHSTRVRWILGITWKGERTDLVGPH
jgi:hypothetical protein